MAIPLEKFAQLKTFKNDGSKRIRLEKTTDGFLPKIAGKTNRGSKTAPDKNYYPQNAHVVNEFELAILEKYGKIAQKKANVEAALAQLFRHHQGGLPLLQRDLSNIFLILNADEQTLRCFLILQGLADAISTDDRFILLLKGSYLNKTRTTLEFTKSLPNKAAKIAFPPYAIVAGCWKICGEVNRLDAANYSIQAAKILKAPFAKLLAHVLHSDSDKKSTGMAINLPFSVIALALSGVSVGIPLLAAPFSYSLAHIAPSYVGPAYKCGVAAITYAADQTLNSASKKTEMPLPVFFVRRDVHGSVEEFPEAGRDKAYSLWEAKTVKALITHLSMPVKDSFWENFNTQKQERENKKRAEQEQEDEDSFWEDFDTEKQERENKKRDNQKTEIDRDTADRDRMLYQEEARIIFKNILGSPCFEDCTVDYAKGLKPNDCIFYVCMENHPDPGETWPSMLLQSSSWPRIKTILDQHSSINGEGVKQRPVSFVRLLAIAMGLAKSHKDAKGEPTDSYYSDKLRKNNWYQHDTQKKMCRQISPLKMSGVPEYLMKPWSGYLPKAFDTDEQIKNYRLLYVEPPKLDDLINRYRQKLYWKSDDQARYCFICGETLAKGSRHHCRICGRIVCSRGTTRLQMKNKENNKIESTRICLHCQDVLEELRSTNGKGPDPQLDSIMGGYMYALRPGDVRIGKKWFVNALKHKKEEALRKRREKAQENKRKALKVNK